MKYDGTNSAEIIDFVKAGGPMTVEFVSENTDGLTVHVNNFADPPSNFTYPVGVYASPGGTGYVEAEAFENTYIVRPSE